MAPPPPPRRRVGRVPPGRGGADATPVAAFARLATRYRHTARCADRRAAPECGRGAAGGRRRVGLAARSNRRGAPRLGDARDAPGPDRACALVVDGPARTEDA